MKYNKIIIAAAMMLVGATYSCTDEWDEHYESKTLGSGSLWQAISSDEQLSNFKAVLEATGYDAALAGSQVFTVFAPTNEYFSEAERDAIIQQYNEQKNASVKDSKNLAIKEFVHNHIALYNYSVSPASVDTTISMMNGKYIAFTKSSFANHDYASSNIVTSNGVLFTIKGKSTYEPNMLEYLEKDADLDSVKNFIYHYNIEKFLPEESVPGEIVDGKINYLDSVTVTQNEILTDWLGALINDEDSSYVMLVPSNAAWDAQLAKNLSYFKYDKEVAERDSFEYIFPRINILGGTVFSKTTNPNILSTSVDSVMSTNSIPYSLREMTYGSYAKKYYVYDKPYAADGIFSGTTDVALSNGIIKKADDWQVSRKQTFLREIVMEGESNTTIDSLNIRSTNNTTGNTLPAAYYSVSSDNKFYNKVSGHGYVEIAPSGSANVTNALFDIRNVLSGVPYDVYVVLAPAEAGDTLASESQRLPTVFRCAMQCHGLDGNAYYIQKGVDYAADPSLVTKYPVFPGNNKNNKPNAPNTATYVDKLTNKDGVSVDSVFVGTYTFPTSSYSVSEAQVKMLIDGRTSNSQVNKGTHTKTLRIDCIVFKPHDEE